MLPLLRRTKSYTRVYILLFSKHDHCCCLVAKLCLTLSVPMYYKLTSLFCVWDFPGKNTGMGCLFLLQACAQLSSIQLDSVTHSCQTLCDPMEGRTKASTSITNFKSLLKLMSIESVIPSNHLILCPSLLLLPSVFSSIRIFSNESALCIRWPSSGASTSAPVLPMNIQD